MESQSSGLQALLVSNQETGQDFDREEVQEQDYGTGKREIIEEAKKQLGLAVPLIAANILQYCLQIISIMFVGHLGELALSGASMATSFASVTGFSVLVTSFVDYYFLFKSSVVVDLICMLHEQRRIHDLELVGSKCVNAYHLLLETILCPPYYYIL